MLTRVSTRDTESSSWHLRAARWYHCTTVNYRDSSVRGYHDKTVLPCGVSPCPCSWDKTVRGQPVSSVARALGALNAQPSNSGRSPIAATWAVQNSHGLRLELYNYSSSNINIWQYTAIGMVRNKNSDRVQAGIQQCVFGTTAHRGPGPPHSRGFKSHTTTHHSR